MRIITDSRCAEYGAYGHPERPQRISLTVTKLRSQSVLPLAWDEPAQVQDEQILRAHSAHHLARLAQSVDFDADTPAYPQILQHAQRSVGGALRALQLARAGESAFSLMRPPGHHACRDRAMGFCYLNNLAIAVLEALATGLGLVAVLDFDVHHGNGTEAVLLRQPGCAVFSIHQFPAYPGTGAQRLHNCFNYPVAPETPRETYRSTLQKALEDLQRFQPKLVAVSAGFDAFCGDPLGHELLEQEDYYWLGQAIRALGVPAFSVLEGGYSTALPDLVLAYLAGLAGR